jgi:rare lipoprotein A
MSTIALCLYFVDELGRIRSTRLAKVAATHFLAYVLGIVFLTSTCVSVETSYAYSASSPVDSPVVIVSLTDAARASGDTPDRQTNRQARPAAREDKEARLEARFAETRKTFWSYGFISADNIRFDADKASEPYKQTAQTSEKNLASNLFTRGREVRHFFAKYRSLAHEIAAEGLQQIRRYAAATNATVIGIASTYNPFVESKSEEDLKTASGEKYDPEAWTAAIQIKLRNQFRGVRFGRLYQPCYALIEAGEKKVIVKINDVGPLKPGRVIDLNERTMRYFDPYLQIGLVQDVKITPLPGEDWIAGPVNGIQLARFASAQ